MRMFSVRKQMAPSQILVIGFAALILLGALLLWLPLASASGKSLRYLDAVFTATSAVCVTGLVVIDTGTGFSFFGQLVILFLIQIGGLGFMTISTALALLAGKKIGLRERLLIQESLNYSKISGLVRLTKEILKVTLIFESIGAVFLMIGFLPEIPWPTAFYYGIFHAVSAFCNAGFDLFGRIHQPFSNLTTYASNWLVLSTIATLIITGGLGFPVLLDLRNNLRGNRLSLHSRLVLTVTLILILIGAILFFFLEYDNYHTLKGQPLGVKILNSFFQSVTPRTAGFNSLDISWMRETTLFLLIMLMFIGASPSSTGGGIKTTTFGALLITVWSMLRGRRETELFERRLPGEVVYKALAVAAISFSLVMLVTFILTVTEEASFLPILFETTSAFGTVGLSAGMTSSLSDIGRIFIILTMFSGRVGLFTIVSALTRGAQDEGSLRYIEEKISIG